MTNHRRSPRRPDPLDALTEQLLECCGMLSLIINGMMEYEAAGRSAPDAPSIPDVLQGLVRDVIEGLSGRHTAADISAAAAIVGEAKEAIGNDIFVVSPETD